jgi:hypothetical protein
MDAFEPPKYLAGLISAANDGAKSAQTTLLDVWQSFRSEMDRLFDCFGGGSVSDCCAGCSNRRGAVH